MAKDKSREKLLKQAFEAGDKEAFSKLLENEVKNLTRFVQHEIAYRQELGDFSDGEVQASEVVDEAIVSAFKDFQEKPKSLPLDYWLYSRALNIVRRMVKERQEGERQEASYDQNIPDTRPEMRPQFLGDQVLDYWQIDEDLGMEDVIPDDRIDSFDESISKKELSGAVHKWLAQLPEKWRAAFLLNKVEGFEVKRIAQVQELSPKEVKRNIEMARRFLKDKIDESRLM